MASSPDPGADSDNGRDEKSAGGARLVEQDFDSDGAFAALDHRFFNFPPDNSPLERKNADVGTSVNTSAPDDTQQHIITLALFAHSDSIPRVGDSEDAGMGPNQGASLPDSTQESATSSLKRNRDEDNYESQTKTKKQKTPRPQRKAKKQEMPAPNARRQSIRQKKKASVQKGTGSTAAAANAAANNSGAAAAKAAAQLETRVLNKNEKKTTDSVLGDTDSTATAANAVASKSKAAAQEQPPIEDKGANENKKKKNQGKVGQAQLCGKCRINPRKGCNCDEKKKRVESYTQTATPSCEEGSSWSSDPPVAYHELFNRAKTAKHDKPTRRDGEPPIDSESYGIAFANWSAITIMARSRMMTTETLSKDDNDDFEEKEDEAEGDENGDGEEADRKKPAKDENEE